MMVNIKAYLVSKERMKIASRIPEKEKKKVLSYAKFHLHPKRYCQENKRHRIQEGIAGLYSARKSGTIPSWKLRKIMPKTTALLNIAIKRAKIKMVHKQDG